MVIVKIPFKIQLLKSFFLDKTVQLFKSNVFQCKASLLFVAFYKYFYSIIFVCWS